MKKLVIFPIFLLMVLSFSIFVSAIEPMNLRNIQEIKSVSPSDVSNLGFGVYQVYAQYNLGSYHGGDWISPGNKKCDDQKFGALWVEVNWDRPETDVILIDGNGNERNIYLPASTDNGEENYGEFYWIAEDGSSYYANTNHGRGWANLDFEEALVSDHLARESLSSEQQNPEEEESLDCGLGEEDSIKLKGQLVDQVTNKPISGATLHSAYEFSPKEVITDESGNFEFVVSSEFNGAYTFYANCYGWSGNIALQKDYQVWEDRQLKKEYDFALVKYKFDSKEEIIDISDKDEVDIGKVYAYPSADISIESDIEASFNVMYQYKNLEGYNGPGNSNFRNEHYLSSSLPLDYETFIQFNDLSGNEHKSSTYKVPSSAMCGIISLKYFDGESEWFVLSNVEPMEESGPIEIELPESIEQNPEAVSSLCLGCFRDKNCYPLGYRKSGKYCAEDKSFITQLVADSTCDNNFECESNVCVNGQCISSGLIQKIINWFSNLFG